MTPDHGSECVCEEIAGEVRDIAISLFAGRLSAETFEQAVVALESAKVKRFGFRLTAERLADEGSRFKLQFADSGKTCATLDFDASSKRLEVHHLCG